MTRTQLQLNICNRRNTTRIRTRPSTMECYIPLCASDQTFVTSYAYYLCRQHQEYSTRKTDVICETSGGLINNGWYQLGKRTRNTRLRLCNFEGSYKILCRRACGRVQAISEIPLVYAGSSIISILEETIGSKSSKRSRTTCAFRARSNDAALVVAGVTTIIILAEDMNTPIKRCVWTIISENRDKRENMKNHGVTVALR